MARTTVSWWAAASGACCETCTRCEGKRSLAGSGSWWRTTLERNERPNERPARKERVFDRPDPACPAAAGRPGTAGGALLAATRGTRSRHESERPARLPARSDSPQRQSREAGTLARRAGRDLATPERGSVRAPAERAGGGLVPETGARDGARSRRAARRIVRDTAALAASLGAGPGPTFRVAPRQSGERRGLTAAAGLRHLVGSAISGVRFVRFHLGPVKRRWQEGVQKGRGRRARKRPSVRG